MHPNPAALNIFAVKKPCSHPQEGSLRVVSNTDTNPKYFHSRRQHLKSRLGCFVCKRRKVKCDEVKPECGSCSRLRLHCEYQNRAPPDYEQKNGASTIPSERAPDLPGLTCSLEPLLISAINDGLWSGEHSLFTRSDLQRLHHFEKVTSKTLTINWCHRAVMKLAFSKSYLMHAILLSAACHLRFLENRITKPTKAELFHSQQMLTKYIQILDHPVTGDDMDAVLATTSLLSAVYFASIETTQPSECWPLKLDSTTSCLQWLKLQRGIRPVIDISKPWRDGSMFRQYFGDAPEIPSPYWDELPGREGIPPELADLCDITSESTVENNPYHGALRLLVPFLHMKCSLDNVTSYLGFTVHIRPEFFALVKDRDPRALLLLCFWYASFSTLGQWWSLNRARIECMALCMYLENVPDPRILPLLEFPARACGYKIRNLRPSCDDEDMPPIIPCAPMC